MKKRMGAVAAALLLILSLAGCGLRDQAPLTVGVIGLPDDTLKGIRLAAAELNENEGIGGAPVEIVEDSREAKILISNESGFSQFCVLPLSKDAADIVDGNAARVAAAVADQGIIAARYIALYRPVASISVICRADDSAALHWMDQFLAEAEELELTVTQTLTYTEMNTVFALDGCSTGAELVFLAMPAEDVAQMLRFATEWNRSDVSFLLTEECAVLPELLGEESGACMAHAEVLTSYLAGSGYTDHFETGYRLYYGEEPTLSAALGYDALYLLAAALGDQQQTGELTTEQLAALLNQSLEDLEWSGATGLMSFDYGNPLKRLFAMQWNGTDWQR